MSKYKNDIINLANEFETGQKTLLALGNANRQHLIIEMMKIDDCYGVRIGTITEKIFHTLLSVIIFIFLNI